MFFFFIKLNNFLISVQILPHNYSAFFYRLTAEHALKHFHKIHIRIFDIQNRLKITNPQQYNTFICVFIYLLLQWWIRGKAKYIPREHKRHLGKKKNTNRDLMEASYGGNNYTQIFGTCFSSSSQIKTDWFAMKWNRSNHFLRRQQIKSHQFLFGC